MPTTLNLTAFTDGVASDPATVEGNFYTPSSNGQGSLEIINGHLGPVNMPGVGDRVGREHIQQGALSNGKAIGGNTNLDYFGDGFLGWDIATENASAVEADKFYRTIPGASMTFFLPYSPSLLVLSWGIFVAAKVDKYDPTEEDGSVLEGGGAGNPPDPYFASNYGAIIRAYLDGSRIDRKYFPVPPKGLDTSIGYGNWDRTWSSFYFVQFPSAGWHNVTLRTIVPPVTVHAVDTNYERPNNQLRVRTRHMDYVYFR